MCLHTRSSSLNHCCWFSVTVGRISSRNSTSQLCEPLLHRTMYRKEGNILFNDALNTFYLRLYGVRHMVKDHSDNERGNPLPPHRLLFPISIRVLLYASSHRQDNTYHSLYYTSRGALAGTRNRTMYNP